MFGTKLDRGKASELSCDRAKNGEVPRQPAWPELEVAGARATLVPPAAPPESVTPPRP